MFIPQISPQSPATIYHPGLVQEASSGRSTQSPTPQIKKKKRRWLPTAAARVQTQV
jgi:hypothetical protein